MHSAVYAYIEATISDDRSSCPWRLLHRREAAYRRLGIRPSKSPSMTFRRDRRAEVFHSDRVERVTVESGPADIPGSFSDQREPTCAHRTVLSVEPMPALVSMFRGRANCPHGHLLLGRLLSSGDDRGHQFAQSVELRHRNRSPYITSAQVRMNSAAFCGTIALPDPRNLPIRLDTP